VEQGICPTAMLYSLAAAYKGGMCEQGAIICHGSQVVANFVTKFVAMAMGHQGKNLNDTIG